MFRNKDTLLVVIERTTSGLDATFSADMAGLHERGDAWKRGRMVRGSIVAALVASAGVTAFATGIQLGDFIPIAIGGLLMSRTVRRVRGEADSREEFERDVANALHRVCDEAERA